MSFEWKDCVEGADVRLARASKWLLAMSCVREGRWRDDLPIKGWGVIALPITEPLEEREWAGMDCLVREVPPHLRGPVWVLNSGKPKKATAVRGDSEYFPFSSQEDAETAIRRFLADQK